MEDILKNKKKTATIIMSEFQYEDRVLIKPLGLEGNVTSFWRKPERLFIEVRYYQDKERKVDFFWEEELEFVRDKRTGF